MSNEMVCWLMSALFVVVFSLLITDIYKKQKGMSLRFWFNCFLVIVGIVLAFQTGGLILDHVFPDLDKNNFFPWCVVPR